MNHLTSKMTVSESVQVLNPSPAKQPADDCTQAVFLLSYWGAVIRLYEPVIFMHSSRSSTGAGDWTHRTEALGQCLQGIVMFFDAYLSIPDEDLACLPLSASTHLSFAIATASRLLFLDDPNWDVQLAREMLDVPALAQRLGNHFQDADLASASQNPNRKRRLRDDGRSIMSTYREKITWIRRWYLSKVAPRKQANSVKDLDYGFDIPPDALDETFWQALLDDGFSVGRPSFPY